MLSNVFTITVIKEKIKVKLALAIPTGAPTALVKEMIDTLSLVARKTIKPYLYNQKQQHIYLVLLMHNFLWFISSIKQFSILVVSFNLYFVWTVRFVSSISMELHSFIFETTQKNYTIIFFKVMRRKQTSKISQFFTCKHKINEPNAKVPTHYWTVCLYSKNVSLYVFVPDKLINFFRSKFHTQTIEINNFTSFTK